MMNDNSVSIGLKSYAKINLSLDVKGVTGHWTSRV